MGSLVGRASAHGEVHRLLWCALSLLFLLSCTQPVEQSATTPAPNTAEPPPAADTRPAIVAFGDSITEGAGVDENDAYPARLEALLNEAGLDYQVINEGISGDASSGGRVRVSTVVAYNPELVVLELGGNDGLRGLPVETTRANLEEIIQALEAQDIEVVLVGMTLPPNYGREYIFEFEQVYRDLADEHNLPLVPVLPEGVAPSPDLVQDDRIHPTPAGHQLLAENVMKAVAPLLKAHPESAVSRP